jgi:ribosome-associated translation inhibitor RaiA
MKIQFNTDRHISGSEEQRAPMIALITEELSRFSSQISRVEVHLSDENSNKGGVNDKRCVLEARLEGFPPIAVTNKADSVEHALDGAIDKLINSLTTKLGRLKKH